MTDSDGIPEEIGEGNITQPMVAKQKDELLDTMLPIEQGRITRKLNDEEILTLVELMRRPTRDLERMETIMKGRRSSR